VRSDRAGAIQAIDEDGLVAWAREHDCVLVVPPAIGVFVSGGARLVELQTGVLPEYAKAVARELARLESTAEGSFGGSVDLDLLRLGRPPGHRRPAAARLTPVAAAGGKPANGQRVYTEEGAGRNRNDPAMVAFLSQFPLAAVIDLNGRPRYFHSGWFLISAGNAVVVVAMIVVFILAIWIPFPRDREPK
jgi:hypothetical protein